MRNFAGFVQDRASYSRVTLNLGLRWSYYDGKIPAQSRRRRQVVPGDQLSGNRSGLQLEHPRAAHRRRLQAHRGRQERREGELQPLLRVDVHRRSTRTINPNSIQTGGIQTWSFLGDLNDNGKADRNELGTLKSQFVAKSNTIDPNLKDPKNDEIMFAFQRELAANWSFNVDWIQRWFRDATTDQNCYGLPCNTVASTVYAPSRDGRRLRPRQHPRHRRRSHADLLRRAAAVRRQGHVLPHQLRQQRHLSTARSATRRPSSRSASGCRTAGRCRARTCGRGSTARSRASTPTAPPRGPRLRLHQPEQHARFGRPGPRRQRSAARLQAARQLPGAVGHQRRRQLPGAQRPADRPQPDRGARAGLAHRPGRAARHLSRRARSTCCRCAPTRASASAATARSFVVRAAQRAQLERRPEQLWRADPELRQPGGVRRGAARRRRTSAAPRRSSRRA